MKSKLIIAALATICALNACTSGDHAPKDPKNTYGVAKDTSKIDTGKATSSDHSASGGSDLVKKDTTKK